MHYEVPGVQLIEQDKNMACWFASAMMVVNWAEYYRANPLRRECSVIDAQTLAMYKANNGIQNKQIIPLAKRLGLDYVPPLCPSATALLNWLQYYGPLWTNGTSHIVVIAGIRGDDLLGYEVKVYDPWPGNGIGWRSLSGWYAGFDPVQANVSSRDTSSDVEAVFLRAA